MLNNLKKVLDDKGITIRAFAKVLGVDERTIQNKIKGKTPFTFLKRNFFQNMIWNICLKKNSKKTDRSAVLSVLA